MKLTCPGCGLIAGAEAWGNDATAREALAAICKLPAPLPLVALQYLSLFRPAKSALSWGRAHRVATELADLVATGYVQVEHRPARSCPPRIWAAAIEEMLGRRDRLTRPMANHNYLRDVAYNKADQADARAEAEIRQAEQNGNYRSLASGADRSDEQYQADWADLSDEQWEMLPAHIRAAHEHERGR